MISLVVAEDSLLVREGIAPGPLLDQLGAAPAAEVPPPTRVLERPGAPAAPSPAAALAVTGLVARGFAATLWGCGRAGT